MKASTAFVHEPDPDNPGWHVWEMTDTERFHSRVMSPMIIRTEGDDSCRVRMLETSKIHTNAIDTVHGGIILSLADVGMFGAAYTICSADAAGAVTLDVDCRFIGTGTIGQPLDAVTEVLRETGRLIFMRGVIEQGDTLVAAYSGTIRKPTRR